MTLTRDASSSWDHTEREILGEKIAALRRIAETLESLIRQAERIRERLPGLCGEELGQAVNAYEAARSGARLYRWYLEVQREALGILRHDVLDRLYPLPPRVSLAPARGSAPPRPRCP